MLKVILNKLRKRYIIKRIFYERLTEPIHLNIISLFVAVFGSYKRKIEYDLIMRQNHAYAILNAAEQAVSLGLKKISIIEFGVASGAGLINMQTIARKVSKLTGVEILIYGFDTGSGMPPPESYKDHPDLYQAGDFPMDSQKLAARLDANVKLVIGQIKETITALNQEDFQHAPIGFVSIDVDYYSSTVDCLEIFKLRSDAFLPRVVVYLDDLEDLNHNSWCGEMAAVNEFNAEFKMRPIEKHAFLRSYRIFRNAKWIDHMYQAHILDHPFRSNIDNRNINKVVLDNFYL